MKTSIRASLRQVRGSDAHPLKWAFEEGSRLGFDGLELCMEAGAWRFELAGSWTREMIDGAKTLCKQYEMSIYSLSSDWAWAYASFFPDFKGWGRGTELLADDAKLAKELGAHTILMHLGTSKGSWEDCKSLLKDAAAAGEENGVTFGFEANIWTANQGFGGLEALCRMADEVDNPYFRVYLHNGYPRAGFPLQEEVEMAGDRIAQAMHSSELVSGRVEIDFEKAFAAMKKSFGDGAYTFEVGWDTVAESKKLLDEMIARYW
jgi:sugar phosphate isomerase/epimerase